MVSFIQPTIRRLETGAARMAVFFCFQELRPFRGIVSLLDWRLHGQLSRRMIDGFFTGEQHLPLLVLPGKRLPIPFLLLMGLGNRDEFSRTVFSNALIRVFDIQRDLNVNKIALTLPGRLENMVTPETAMEWFIDAYDTQVDFADEIFIIEPPITQKAMIPVLDRWRLRRLIPGFTPA